jgi:phosphoserine phosphatase
MAQRARDVRLVTTVTWKFAAEFFQDRYGLDAVSGCEMEEDENGILQGKVKKHFEAEEKIDFLQSFCLPRGIDLEQCVAVGDSRSDIPLFGKVGLAIALNATADAEAAAHVALRTADLRDIIPVVEAADIA